jgi:hypothetical protein
VILALSLAASTAAEPVRDPQVQARLEGIVEAVVASAPDVADRIDHLDAAAPSREELLLQIALFLSDAGGTEEAMTGAIVLHRLAFTPDEKIAAIVPQLGTDDEPLLRVLDDLLSTVDRPEGGAPDFAPYLPRLRGEAPPEGLLRYLYTVDPGRAVDAMVTADPRRKPDSDVAVVETVRREQGRGGTADPTALDRSRAALDRLSRSPAWWLRLYAAAVLEVAPSLADPGVAARLARDENAVVRRLAGG